jgi:DNA-binding NarL/FixJ family response regulator
MASAQAESWPRCLVVEVLRARMLLVDDHELFRRGLALVIQATLDLKLVDAVASAVDALSLASRVKYDIAIIDVLMPTTSGITLCNELSKMHPTCRVLVLSAIDDPSIIAQMLRGGACGFALKSQPAEEIIVAIRGVLRGVRYIAPTVSALVQAELAVPETSLRSRLTRRECEVFELLIRGNSNEQIATNLGISQRTVETHSQRVTQKLPARSLAEIRRVAMRLGGLGP